MKLIRTHGDVLMPSNSICESATEAPTPLRWVLRASPIGQCLLPGVCSFLRLIVFVAILLAIFGSSQAAIAGGGPENVVLVVNANSASSKMLANHYIQLRKIPPRNVIYLEGIGDREIAGWKHFKKIIFEPLIAEMDRRKLAGSVDYIVYSSDFPTAIEITKHQKAFFELLNKNNGGKPNPLAKIYNADASLTSLTYFIGAAMQENPGYLMMDSNNYYRNRASVLLRRPFVGEQQEKYARAVRAVQSDSKDEIQSAIKVLIELGKKNQKQLAVHYSLAQLYGKLGDAKNATAWLSRSIRLGWCYQKKTRSELAFEKVKDDPLFRGIVDRIPDQPFEYLPTHGFKHQYAWAPNGMLNSEPNQGNRHFLCTMLAVTRNYGMTEKQALQNMRLSVAADESKPQGTFYFTETKDVRTTTRMENFKFAVDQLKSMGFGAEIVNDILPVKRRDVLGLTCGTPNFNWIASGSILVPGAFCDNLTSIGGAFHKPGQTKATEFMVHGAAGGSGTVIEPYTVQAKFPYPMFHVHYARGCTLAEAFYQSVHGPFQTIVVGDALCQPWATKPVIKVTGVEPGESVSGKVNLRLDASKSPASIAGIEFYVDGRIVHRVPLQEKIQLDTSNMADGFHEIRIVAIADNTIGTTGNVILPISINNKGQAVKLSTEHADYLETDKIAFKVESNFGDSIELVHNGRTLAKKIGRDIEIELPANLLGRGPITVYAVAVSEDGGEVKSSPIEFFVEGRISELKRNTEQPKMPKTK